MDCSLIALGTTDVGKRREGREGEEDGMGRGRRPPSRPASTTCVHTA